MSPLADLAVLLGRPGRPARVVTAGEEWTPGDDPVVLWGRPALPLGTGPRRAAPQAAELARQARALRRRPPGGLRAGPVQRLDPPELRTGAGARLRRALLAGAVVELAADVQPRVVDLVLAQAGAHGPLEGFRLGAGGTVLVRVTTAHGPAVLRVAREGSAGDPAAVARALTAVGERPLVPALLGAGTAAGASWTVESLLAGRRPRRLTAGLLVEIAAFTAGLPAAPGAPSVAADLAAVARAVPAEGDRLLALAGRTDRDLAGLPAAARHGDLWLGNLLVDGDRLSGVLDWDAWAPAAVPGTDLLHLVATDLRVRGRRSLGEVFLDRPWTAPHLRLAADAYWERLGVRPTAAQQDAVGTAWWAAQLAGDLARTPALADQERWLRLNVTAVLDRLDAAG